MKVLRLLGVAASIILTGGPPAPLAQSGPTQPPPQASSSPQEQQQETLGQAAPQSLTTSTQPTLRLDMEEVTVTATKSKRSTFDTPAAVSVIDRQEIEALQPQAITDLLRYQAGVDIGNGPLRITERPFIRGLGGNRLLLTVDGARLNFNTAHGGNLNFIDVESLERLEIVRGPASALYGSSALGGVISLRTKDPRDMLTPGQRIGARLQSSFNSANQEFAQHVSLYGVAKDNFDYMLSYTRRDASDVRTAERMLDNSGYTLDDFLLKGLYHLTEKDTVGLNVQLFRDSSDFPLAPDARFAGRRQEDDEDRDLYSLRYERQAPDSWLSELSLVGYLQRTDIASDERQRRFDSTGSFVQSLNLSRRTSGFDTWGTELRGATVCPVFHHRHRLTYGFEFFRDEADQLQRTNTTTFDQAGAIVRNTSAIATTFPDAIADNFGFYLQDEVTLFDRLTLIPGIRYDIYQLDSQQTEGFAGALTKRSVDADEVNPKIGAVLALTESLNLVGSVAKGFRAPSYRELFIAGPHFPGAEFIANPALKPETGLSYEGGVKGQFSNLRFGASYFYNDFDDFIDFRVVSPPGPSLTFQAVNVTKARIWGVEAEVGWRPRDFLYLYSNYTYTRGDDRTTNTPLASISPQRGVVGLRYTDLRHRFWLEWTARIVDDQNRVPAGVPRTPGYAVFDVRGSWQVLDKLRVSVAIENLLDRAYREHLTQSVFDAPGINLATRLVYDW